MTFKSTCHTFLTLLVTAGLLIGGHSSPTWSRGVPAATYYCCCPGECSCTSDCCNHGPTRTRDDRQATMREGAGVPAWHSTDWCGVRQSTLQRGPDTSKVFVIHATGRVLVGPDRCHKCPSEPTVLPSTTADLIQSSPRAPPPSSILA
jgi:hypothetical protein